MLGGVIDPDYHGEIGLLLHNGGKDYVWNAGDPLGCPLGLLMPHCEELPNSLILRFQEAGSPFQIEFNVRASGCRLYFYDLQVGP